MDTAAPILIVEDDELVRSFLARALSRVTDHIDTCGSGAEAMRAVADTRYSAILLDGLLPDIHGVELARQMVRLPRSAASGICFISGSLRRPVALRSGVSALPKPLRLRELTDTVTQLLSWHGGDGGRVDDRLAALDAIAADLLVS